MVYRFGGEPRGNARLYDPMPYTVAPVRAPRTLAIRAHAADESQETATITGRARSPLVEAGVPRVASHAQALGQC